MDDCRFPSLLKQLTLLDLSIKCKSNKSVFGRFCLNFNNKHLRLRDSQLSLVWLSGGLRLSTNAKKKTKKKHG